MRRANFPPILKKFADKHEARGQDSSCTDQHLRALWLAKELKRGPSSKWWHYLRLLPGTGEVAQFHPVGAWRGERPVSDGRIMEKLGRQK